MILPTKYFLLPLQIALLLLINACAQQPVEDVVPKALSNTLKDIEKKSQESTATPQILQRDTNSPANQSDIRQADEKALKRFDISVNQIEAKTFFTQLMSATGSNIIVHPDIKGKISLRLRQVTLPELLEVVQDVYGFAYKYSNNIYTVYARELRTAIFPINYIDVKRVGVSDTSVLTGTIESNEGSNATTNDQSADLVGAGNSITPGSRIQTHSEADFWSSLRLSIAEIIGSPFNHSSPSTTESTESTNPTQGERSKVIVNPQTGVVVVTAMPDKLDSVRRFLEEAQLSIRRQVIIEAKILEIELSQGYEAGVNWEEINGQLLLGNNVSEFTIPNTITEASDSVGEIFSSLIKITDIRKLLSLLETQGNIQVLSSPRVSTVNNQKAVIRVGSDRFFVTGISNTTTTSSGSTTNNPDIELSSFFSGISLDVTPQISSDDEVIMHIHPVISTVTEELKEIAVGDSAFSLPLAARDIRESDSIVRAANSQIIVLGGLMQEKTVNADGKRPVLGDIPVLNTLFRTTKKQQVKSELIILLKPIIVDSDTWVKNISSSKDRVNQWNTVPRL